MLPTLTLAESPFPHPQTRGPVMTHVAPISANAMARDINASGDGVSGCHKSDVLPIAKRDRTGPPIAKPTIAAPARLKCRLSIADSAV